MICKKDKSQFQSYLTDASNYKGNAEALYIPESLDELVNLVKDCNKNKTRITLSGNGTGLTGGRVAEEGIVISFEKFDKILELNKNDKTITVQSGVLLKDLQEFVEKEGFFYPPDPTERNCFIGGNIVTNASGARTFKYGPTRNYVESLKILLSNGKILELDRNSIVNARSRDVLSNYNVKIPAASKNASGFYCSENQNLIDLFIGSEGLLGLIVEARLKLLALPNHIFSAIVFFESETNAIDFIEESRNLSKEIDSILDARGLEFFDERSLTFLSKDYTNIPKQAKAAVWFEQEIDQNEDILIENWTKLLEKHNYLSDFVWFAFDEKDLEKFKDFRHSISWKVNEYIAQKNFKKVGTDVAVADNFFKEFYFSSKKMVEDSKLDFVSYGHFGNSHLHLNMLPKNEDEYIIAKKLYKSICQNAISINGTISAEHGIGKLKREYFEMMYSEEEILQMARIKKHYDPNLILNIGNMIDPKYYSMI